MPVEGTTRTVGQDADGNELCTIAFRPAKAVRG